MANNPVTGAAYAFKGLHLITKPGLRLFVLIPLLINILLFAGGGWYLYHELDAWISALLPDWLSWLEWLVRPVLMLGLALLGSLTFVMIANLVASPFNGLLAEKVEAHLTGRSLQTAGSFADTLKEIIPSLIAAIRMMLYIFIRMIPLGLLFFIPGVNVIAPFIWMLFGAWMMALSYLDFPMGNHGLLFSDQVEKLKERRMTGLGFGGAMMLLSLIPFANFFAVPIGVAGATALWVDQWGSEDIHSAETVVVS